MPGLSGCVGGREPDAAQRVVRLLGHFPFYSSRVVGGADAWLAWTGVGTAQRRVEEDSATGILAGYHGDGVEGFPPAAAAARLARVRTAPPRELAEACEGSFAAARWDPASRELTLVTDPFGIRRVFYLHRGGSLRFAPELKAFLAWPDFRPEPDPVALRQYLNYNYPLGDRTSLRDVRLLPPASVLVFRDGKVDVRSYWRPRYEPEEADDETFVSEGTELFRRSFDAKAAPGRRLVVPVSGGLDSRLLLAEARRRDHPLLAYTYGHARSREARVALRVMAACGAGDRFIVQDPPPDPVGGLLTTSWFGEGMVDTSVMALAAVNAHLADEGREALFLNGIYGGPTNFSNGYHRPEELTRDMPPREQAVRIGYTMTGRRDPGGAGTLLRPDWAAACARAFHDDLAEGLAKHEDASPLFGHRKDAFFIANRLCRFINQVDLNRFYWDCTVPLTSFSLYRFYLRLPDRQKFGRLLHRRIVAGAFPAVANVVNFNSGRTVVEELAGAAPRVPGRLGRRLRYYLGRATRGALSTPDPEGYQAPEHTLRRSRPLREFVGDLLSDPAFRAAEVFDQRRVRRCYDDLLAGAEVGRAVHRVVAWELWLRQLETRSREVR